MKNFLIAASILMALAGPTKAGNGLLPQSQRVVCTLAGDTRYAPEITIDFNIEERVAEYEWGSMLFVFELDHVSSRRINFTDHMGIVGSMHRITGEIMIKTNADNNWIYGECKNGT